MKIFGGFMAAVSAMVFSLAVSLPAQADLNSDLVSLQTMTALAARTAGLNWHVGDKAEYSLDIGGFIKGTSNNFVRQDTGTGFWMQQDMNLAGQKQKIEILINKSNGQVEKVLVNGQPHELPKSNPKVVESREDKITVAAGSFDCIYFKIEDQDNKQITEAWINPKVMPMNGVLKALQDSQYGKVKQEATSMEFGN